MRTRVAWRLACGAAAVVLVSAWCGCAGPASRQGLMETARTAPTSAQRYEALVHLKGHVDASMRPDLEIILAQELDPASRALAAELLGEIGDPASAPELSRSVRADTRGVVRQKALDALAAVQGAAAADDIQYALHSDPEPAVRANAAVLARKHLPQADATPLLLAALKDHAAVVRLQASAMLEELTGLKAAPNAESWQSALAAAQKP